MGKMNDETVPGLALLVLAAAVTWLSLDMGTGAAGATLKPNFFPLICAAGIAICGLVLFVRGVMKGEGRLPSLVDRRFAIVAGLLVVYYWWFQSIDFRVGAWVFALVTMLAFGIRSIRLLAAYPVILTAVLYFGFTDGFGVVLPSWN
ncbi:tripartite tricarboxylate transporter TctB family protein [Lutibaculum baratangense]|uniref:DUF1468 domain-containing protein n=1 Tax=Lutibaculum baratangense AMV1 TaxID=631454 RepID=V4RLC4_9HYPH|nr:tripartite tricarboxylate transporter TctB family protein [Lutibaculum baratangense]ESR26856.1 hypothetical protein N177_0640 [Lutibaculum baratangense AMV1]